MSMFKGIFPALFGVGLVFSISSGANAVPVNVTFSTTVSTEFGDIADLEVGDTWTLTFTVDNGGASLFSQSWGVGDIVGDVIGSASNGYSATYGTTGASLTLETDVGGALLGTVTYQDFDSGDNSDTVGAAVALFTTTGPVSDNDFAQLVLATTNEEGWTLELESSGGRDVPEPGALALFGAGLIGMAFVRRRKKAAC